MPVRVATRATPRRGRPCRPSCCVETTPPTQPREPSQSPGGRSGNRTRERHNRRGAGAGRFSGLCGYGLRLRFGAVIHSLDGLVAAPGDARRCLTRKLATPQSLVVAGPRRVWHVDRPQSHPTARLPRHSGSPPRRGISLQQGLLSRRATWSNAESSSTLNAATALTATSYQTKANAHKRTSGVSSILPCRALRQASSTPLGNPARPRLGRCREISVTHCR